MRLLSALYWLKWPATLAGLAGLLGGAYSLHNWMQTEHAAEPAERTSGERVRDGRRLNIRSAVAQSLGLVDQKAEAAAWAERVTAYGRVVPNPLASTEVRSPSAGTLRVQAGQAWPRPGEMVAAGRVVGLLVPRFGPLDRLDFQAKLNEAKLKFEGAGQVLQIQQDKLDRLKKVGTPEIVARRELDEALVQVAEARTLQATSKAAVDLWQKALDGAGRQGNDPAWSVPLTAPAAGEVTEVLAVPGAVVEAGAVVVRVVDFQQPLIRLDLPREVAGPAAPREVTLFPVDAASGAVGRLATYVGQAASVEPASQFLGCLYAIHAGTPSPQPAAGSITPWRPGLYVKSLIVRPDASTRPAVSVPVEAVLLHQGMTLVYVHERPGTYARRAVEVVGRDGERCYLAPRPRFGLDGIGVDPGEAVVSKQAQTLLAAEFLTPGDADD
jgi:multidrug resistance efflux pump